jgi:hypothetical protein
VGNSPALRNPRAQFLLAAFFVLGACVLIARSRLFAANADVAAWGVTFDLTITIPLLYWWLIVRPGRAHAITIAPVFILGTIAAASLLPAGQRQFVGQLRLIGLPIVELLVIAAVIQRVRRLRFTSTGTGDAHARIELAVRAIAGEGRVAAVVASELTILYYAFFGWTKTAERPAGRGFTVHERNGWSTVLACIIVLVVAESLGMHLLLMLWSPLAAWIWTGLDLWAIVWLLGDFNALRLRPSWIDGESLHLRYGLRWSVSVPISSIASVEDVREESQWKRRDVLKVAMLEEPRWLISFREPVVARGMAGLRKTITAIALLADDDDAITFLQSEIDRPRDTRAAHP